MAKLMTELKEERKTFDNSELEKYLVLFLLIIVKFNKKLIINMIHRY